MNLVGKEIVYKGFAWPNGARRCRVVAQMEDIEGLIVMVLKSRSKAFGSQKYWGGYFEVATGLGGRKILNTSVLHMMWISPRYFSDIESKQKREWWMDWEPKFEWCRGRRTKQHFVATAAAVAAAVISIG